MLGMALCAVCLRSLLLPDGVETYDSWAGMPAASFRRPYFESDWPSNGAVDAYFGVERQFSLERHSKPDVGSVLRDKARLPESLSFVSGSLYDHGECGFPFESCVYSEV